MSLINDLIQKYVAQQKLVNIILNGDIPNQEEIDELDSRIEALEQGGGSGGSGGSTVENVVVFNKVEKIINENEYETVLKNHSGVEEIHIIDKVDSEGENDENKCIILLDESGQIIPFVKVEPNPETEGYLIKVSNEAPLSEQEWIDRFIETQPPEERIYAEWDTSVLNSLSPEDLAAVERLNNIDRYKVCQRGDGKIKLLGANMLKNVVSFNKVEEFYDESDLGGNSYQTSLKNDAGDAQIVIKDLIGAGDKDGIIVHVYDENDEEIVSENEIFKEYLSMIVKYEQQQHILEENADGGAFADQLAEIQSMTPEEIAEAGATQEEFDSYVEAYQLLNSIRRFSDIERIPDGTMTLYGKNYIDGRLQNMNDLIYNNGNDIRELKRYQTFSYDETNQELKIFYHCFPENTATTIDIDFTYQDSSFKKLHDIVYIGNDTEQIKSDILQFEFFAPTEYETGDHAIKVSLNVGEYVDYVGIPGITVSCSHCFYDLTNEVITLDKAEEEYGGIQGQTRTVIGNKNAEITFLEIMDDNDLLKRYFDANNNDITDDEGLIQQTLTDLNITIEDVITANRNGGYFSQSDIDDETDETIKANMIKFNSIRSYTTETRPNGKISVYGKNKIDELLNEIKERLSQLEQT